MVFIIHLLSVECATSWKYKNQYKNQEELTLPNIKQGGGNI